MLLKDLLESLKYSELGATTFGKVKDNSEDDRVISYINSGLVEFYSKYDLLEKDVLIRGILGLNKYTLSDKYALTNTNSSLPVYSRYILDTVENPFINDVIRIKNIYKNERELLINVKGKVNSAYLISPNTFQILEIDHIDLLNVSYFASHPVIFNSGFENYLQQVIELPIVFQIAFKAYIGYSYYNSLSGQGQSAKGQEYYNRYLSEIDICTKKGLLDTSETFIDNNFSEMGWV